MEKSVIRTLTKLSVPSIYKHYIQNAVEHMAERQPLYEHLMQDIKSRIERGTYHTGARIDSLNMLCKRYGVSKITAIRAVDELETMGLLRKVAGKGTFVTGMRYEEQRDDSPPPLRGIILFSKGFIEHTADSNFAGRIYNSIAACACEAGIDFKIEHVRETEIYGSTLSPFTPAPDEGMIALAGDSMLPMLHLFTNPNCRRVLVDTSVAGVPNVLSDNYNGIKLLLEHLAGLGHRDILFAGRFADGQNFVNENERHEAFFQLAASMGLKPSAIMSGNFEDIFRVLRRDGRPSAIMFSRDDPALKLIDDLRQRGCRLPEELSVTGFDHFASQGYKLDPLTTVKVDTGGLGRAAVGILREAPDPLYRVPLTRRVPVQLLVKHSSAAPGNNRALPI